VFSNPAASGRNFTVHLAGAPRLTVTVERASGVTGPGKKKINVTIPDSGALLFDDSVAGRKIFCRTVYPAY